MSLRTGCLWLIQRLRELLFPQGNACMGCGSPLMRRGVGLLCADCEAALDEVRLPAALATRAAESPLCEETAAFDYAGTARKLVRMLKYNGATLAALPLSRAMAPLIDPSRWDVIVPVPMHKRRLNERGYNQAGVLCARVSELCGLRMDTGMLRRTRHTRSQVKLDHDKRQANVQDAFAADAARARGKRVLLLDDVRTTGATSRACAAALLAAGAANVGLITACRA